MVLVMQPVWRFPYFVRITSSVKMEVPNLYAEEEAGLTLM